LSYAADKHKKDRQTDRQTNKQTDSKILRTPTNIAGLENDVTSVAGDLANLIASDASATETKSAPDVDLPQVFLHTNKPLQDASTPSPR